MKIRALENSLNDCGEMPVWHQKEQVLYWIDVLKPKLFSYHLTSDSYYEYTLPDCIYFMEIAPDGYLYAILGNDLVQLHINDHKLQIKKIIENLCDDSRVRFNDGKFDAKGRLFSGTMDFEQKNPIGKLYCISPSGKIEVVDEGFIVSNGTDFNHDFTSMYFTDSRQSTIYQYDYNLENGSISNKRPLVIYDHGDGVPDGMAVDRNGDLWVAVWSGWRIDHFSSDGQLIESIKTTARNMTCPVFAGDNQQLLFATSATFDLEAINDMGKDAGKTLLINLKD
ncbi:SMP-30/gluconolactonase/LRE family protein [Thiotrichales bacterium 19X7-9]|nr:SMP-30/gluconolactonase/LRE family protein [Thiotrichales bacterium 19X7-9]